MLTKRMYKVIVGGGVVLAGSAFAAATSCGGETQGPAKSCTTCDDAGSDGASGDTFPLEGPAPYDSDIDTYFPAETATIIDSGFDSTPVDSATDTAADTFPSEGPVPPDSGPDGAQG